MFVYGDKRKPKNTSGNYPETSYTIGNIEFISTRDAEIKAFLIKSEIDNGIYPDSLKYPNESPRVCQRLNNLRNWNYEKIKSLYIRIS